MNFIRTSLLGLAAAASLAAQSTGFSVGGGLILAPSQTYFGAYDKAVNNNNGLYLGGGYDFKLYQTDVDARASLTIGYMPGKERNGLTTSLLLTQASGDIFLSLGSESVRGLFGLSVNFYSATFDGTENTADRGDVEHHFPFKNCSGAKLGYRIGFDFAVSKNVTTELLFQQTELAGSDLSEQTSLTNATPFVRRGGINPSWLQFGVRYHF